VNQKGRTERIHVNLEAIYPTPEIMGSELSLEELRAGHRGWLSKVWEPERQPEPFLEVFQDSTEESKVDNIIREVSEKLVIARDPINLDENGITKEPVREGRGRRMKIKEVNETQISMETSWSILNPLTIHSQSKVVFAFGKEDDQTQSIQGTNNDSTYSSCH
jgi:checkpoint serine/threonine-protein kinase